MSPCRRSLCWVASPPPVGRERVTVILVLVVRQAGRESTDGHDSGLREDGKPATRVEGGGVRPRGPAGPRKGSGLYLARAERPWAVFGRARELPAGYQRLPLLAAGAQRG